MKTIDTKATESIQICNHLEAHGGELAELIATGLPTAPPDAKSALASSITLYAALTRHRADAAATADADHTLAVRDRIALAAECQDALTGFYATTARARALIEGSFGPEIANRVAGKGATPRRRAALVAWAQRFERRLRDDAATWPTVPAAGPVDRHALADEVAARVAAVESARAKLKAHDGHVATLRLQREEARRALADTRVGLAALTEGLLALAGQRAAVPAVLPKSRKRSATEDTTPEPTPVVDTPKPALPPASTHPALPPASTHPALPPGP